MNNDTPMRAGERLPDATNRATASEAVSTRGVVDSVRREAKPLTPRQLEVLDYVRAFIATHGYAPSLAEIGEALGLSSLATVSKHLDNLRRKGHITRTFNRSRMLEIVQPQVPQLERYEDALRLIADADWRGGAWCMAVAREALGLPPVVVEGKD